MRYFWIAAFVAFAFYAAGTKSLPTTFETRWNAIHDDLNDHEEMREDLERVAKDQTRFPWGDKI